MTVKDLGKQLEIVFTNQEAADLYVSLSACTSSQAAIETVRALYKYLSDHEFDPGEA